MANSINVDSKVLNFKPKRQLKKNENFVLSPYASSISVPILIIIFNLFAYI